MSIGNGRSELGIGRADTYDASHMVAILEILERYAGYIPRGKATVVESAYATICGEAIHPPSFGLHDHEYYADPESPVTPFDPETCYRWVWGYSFARRRPILIPEQLVYFGVPVQKERRFCVEISNGCAVGSCVEEALFYGLLEVIERDCFLLAWYSQSQLPEIDRSTLKRAETIQLLERVELVTRSKIRLFDATFDIGIPVIWALASHGTGPLVATGSAAGAHIDPEQAICSALRELGPAVVAAATRMINEEDYARLLASDNWSVKTMPDHSLLYRVPTTSSRLDFLRNTTRVRSVNDMIPEGFANRDLRDDLTELIGRVLRCGMDVLFIEQTPINFPRTLRVVKVLVPGMLPMTFGHTARRISGLPRVHEVPYRLGLTFNRHTSINLDPHPFP
jgi:ribosomal protein S12 methylthiotransferase accessory factor